MITFAVSDVTPAREALTGFTLEESLRRRIGRVEAGRCNAENLVGSFGNGFVAAALASFSQHYPLVLSPDDVWLCLVQGVATHVRLHAEELRSRLVQHEGKLVLAVRRDDFVRGSSDNDWPGVFAELSDALAAHVGKKRDLFVASFSTTGPIERAASEVALLEVFQSYFDYRVDTLCGIPEVTLLGTVQDWLSVRTRAAVLGELGLEDWMKWLLPVLDRILETAAGRTPDGDFWRSFVKVRSMSGGPFINGWINVLFPYIETWGPAAGGGFAIAPIRNASLSRWARHLKDTSESVQGPSVSDFPVGLSRAPFVWNYLGTEIPMVFSAGFVGVSQDPATKAVRPAIGWTISEAPPEKTPVQR